MKALLLLSALLSPQADSVEELVERLEAFEPKTRRAAAAELEKLGADAAVPLVLLFAAEGKPLRVRLRASRVLLHLHSKAKRAIPILRAQLVDSEVSIRRRAAFVLSPIDPDLVKTLIPLLEHKEPAVREDAALGLRRLGEPAVTPLIGALRGKSPMARLEAADTLGRMAPVSGDALPALREALGHPDPPLRERAARALGAFGHDGLQSEPALVARLVKDKVLEVRRSAAAALLRIVPARPVTVTQIEPFLLKADVQLRRSVAGILLRMEGRALAALPTLKVASNDKDPVVAEIARTAVRRLDPEWEDPDPAPLDPKAPVFATPEFPFRTLDHLPADLFVDGIRRGSLVYSWSFTAETELEAMKPVDRWPPPGSRLVGTGRRRGAGVDLYITLHPPEGRHVLYVGGMVGKALLKGKVRLRVIGHDGGLYRYEPFDPSMAGDEDPIASYFKRSIWFGRVSEE